MPAPRIKSKTNQGVQTRTLLKLSEVEKVKGKRKAREQDKPVLETETYRLWDAAGMTKEEQEEAKKVSLGVAEGERIHEIVTFGVGAGLIIKVISKQRISDGLLKVLIRIDKPDGRCSVIRYKAWIPLEQYDSLVSDMKKELGAGRATVVKGEELHIGLSQVIKSLQKNKQRKTGRGHNAPDTPPGTASTGQGDD
jgi:hypothetical protein